MSYGNAGGRNPRLVSLLFSLFSLLFFFSAPALGVEVTFSWLPNSEEDLAGYKIYYGTVSQKYTTVVDVGNPDPYDGRVTFSLDCSGAGLTYYITATAYNEGGLESDYCPEVVWQCPVIEPENHAPVASVVSLAGVEDKSCSGMLAASDVDGDALTFSLVNDASLGTVTITDAASGAFVYTPMADVFGTDSFTFKVSDGQAESNAATVTVTIAEVNDLPVAEDGFLSVDQGATGSAILSAADVDDDVLTFALISDASLGAVELDAGTGTYRYTAFPGMVGEDEFSFVVSDGEATSNTATVKVDVVAVEPEFQIELGEVMAGGEWLRVVFDKSYVDPVIVAKPASSADEDPGVVQIRNVDYDGFEIRFKNWDYLTAVHGPEMIGYVVLERGCFVLPDGSMVEAGYFTSNAVSAFENVPFMQAFNHAPVVAASVVSVNEEDAVTDRLRGISQSGFSFRLQEQELNVQEHDFEKVAYIAWEPGVGLVDGLVYNVGQTGDVVTHSWFTLGFEGCFTKAPVLLADMQSADGGDTANLRYETLTVSTAQVKVSEEQSRDDEVSHTTENVGFMLFDLVDPAADADGDGLSFAEEFSLYHSNPALADSDGDGLDDGDEVAFWGADWNADFDGDGLINLLDADADDDGYLDGAELAAASDPADAASWPGSDGSLQIEFGELSVASEWLHVSFEKVFVNPVVVAYLVSRDDAEPCVVRVKNIDASGFDLRLQEWGYLDDLHGVERVAYLVMESGSYELADGTRIEARSFTSAAASSYDQVNFVQAFNQPPVVLASIAGYNGGDTVCARLRNISTTGLEFKLQEQELNAKSHVEEPVCYIAWEASVGNFDGVNFEVGSTLDKVTHKDYGVDFSANFSTDPILLAAMQTTDGGDTSVSRCATVTSAGFEVFIEEEQSRDTEINHTSEVVGFIALR